jgi:hypothetical protein
MAFVLPPKSQVGVIDPEISGEGQKVEYNSAGEQVSWSPPPPQPVMPDWSRIKSIARYFQPRTNIQSWPAWLYHPTEGARIVKNQHEAAELGVCYRKATDDEKGRYGRDYVWDWREDSLWRPTPYEAQRKFDPNNPGPGKTYVASPPSPRIAQNDMIAALIPAVAAAVAQSLKASGPTAPANVDPKQWEAFLQFQAWQKTKDVVETVVKEEEPREIDRRDDTEPPDDEPALAALSPEQERPLWLEEAERKGVKVDGRWSLARLKAEVEKAA